MLTVTYTWKCDLCERKDTKSSFVTELPDHHGCVSQLGNIPEGWSIIGRLPIYAKLVCPAHKIEIDKAATLADLKHHPTYHYEETQIQRPFPLDPSEG